MFTYFPLLKAKRSSQPQLWIYLRSLALFRKPEPIHWQLDPALVVLKLLIDLVDLTREFSTTHQRDPAEQI